LDVGKHIDADLSIAFQDAKYRDFVGCAATSFAFSAASEVGFVKFYFPTQKRFGILIVSQNGQPDGGDSLVGRVIG
jgi:hypothetical protein